MHESGRAAKKGNTYHVNDVRWTWLGGGGGGRTVPDYKYIHNQHENEFLLIKWSTHALVRSCLYSDGALDDKVYYEC